MHFKILLPFLLLLCCQCSTTNESEKQETPPPAPAAFSHAFPNTSIRAIKGISEQEVHFAGSDGSYGFTVDKGKNWQVDTVKIDGKGVHFRGIEVTEKGRFLMGIESPAYLIHIPADSAGWDIVYQEDHEKAFYDAIQMKGDLGVMMGDPTDGCLSVVLSRDGGETWHKIPCESLPPIEEGVAAFAASNSNVSIQGNHIWLVTGGKKALVYHSADAGKTWASIQSPIAEGNTMTGIFACDFYDEKTGVIVGGDWDKKEDNTASIAFTNDGGKTWTIPASEQQIGFNSDVQFISDNKNAIVAASSEHLMISKNTGKTWTKINDLKPYAIQLVGEGKGWAAGKEFIAFFEY